MFKKRLLIFMTLILTLALFAACGDQTNNKENNPIENEENNTEAINNLEGNEEEEEEHRIIATTVALVEIMDELELDLVGVPTSYKELPERYRDATEVGMAAEPDMEIIRSLKPTDVLSATTLDTEFDLATIFDDAKVPVTFVDMESVEGMYEGILDLGEKYDRIEIAEDIVDNFEEKISEIEERIQGQEPPI